MTARRSRGLRWGKIWWAWYCVNRGWGSNWLGVPSLGRTRDDWLIDRCDRRFKAHRSCGPRRVQIVEVDAP